MKKQSFFALVIFCMAGLVLAQSSGARMPDESETVYVAPGDSIFHLKTCEKLGDSYTGMPLSYAKKKNYSPCSICLSDKKEVMQIKPVVPTQKAAVIVTSEDRTVYITNTGKKYHLNGCRYLSKSKIKTTLKDVCNRGYTPCSVCKPPKCK